MRYALLVGILGLGVLALPSCKQGEGEACQVNSDCKSGLVCCFDSETGKGTCHATCVAPVDAGPDGRVDAEPQDAEPMDAAPVDAAPVDAAPVDGAPVDAAPVDAAPVDAAPVDAAPVDATVDASQ